MAQPSLSITDPVKVELLRIAQSHGGLLRPADVVQAARPSTSILHPHFEWDDTEAAEKYRLNQARALIRVTVEYIAPGRSGPDRVFVSLSPDRSFGRGYRTIVSVLSDSDMRAQLLADAITELETFRRKYARLNELSEVFAAARKVIGKKKQ